MFHIRRRWKFMPPGRVSDGLPRQTSQNYSLWMCLSQCQQVICLLDVHCKGKDIGSCILYHDIITLNGWCSDGNWTTSVVLVHGISDNQQSSDVVWLSAFKQQIGFILKSLLAIWAPSSTLADLSFANNIDLWLTSELWMPPFHGSFCWHCHYASVCKVL